MTCTTHNSQSVHSCVLTLCDRLKQLNLALLFRLFPCSGCQMLSEDASSFCLFPVLLSTLDGVSAVIRPIILFINNILIPSSETEMGDFLES